MPATPPALTSLAARQRDVLTSWLPDLAVEADMSWGLVETTVLRVTSGGRTLVVKAGGEQDSSRSRKWWLRGEGEPPVRALLAGRR
ncbi:hypothetical protein [Isoptericola sp. NPDC019482]|uniref:hypothetical protein n=1 Tax=Isoptericola sp. NPDC019482 TaxID=3154688 RepID=UPI00348937A9